MSTASENPMPKEDPKILFEQMKRVLEMHGIPLADKTQAYMQPLLDGSMSYEEHAAFLERLIQAHENDQ